jgi:hypothetical protein
MCRIDVRVLERLLSVLPFLDRQRLALGLQATVLEEFAYASALGAMNHQPPMGERDQDRALARNRFAD